MKRDVLTAIGPEPTNGAATVIESSVPYRAELTIIGTADLLWHRWNCEAVEEKSKAAKGSKAKKTDNIESYVYRNDAAEICFPGEYLRMPIIAAAKFRQDPRSPRKSAMDLYKAGVIPLTAMAPLYNAAGEVATAWDYEHKGRVVVQRSAITRIRPAFKAGWSATIVIMVNLPEYIRPDDLLDVTNAAGRLCGTGDFRPTYGRFAVSRFRILGEEE